MKNIKKNYNLFLDDGRNPNDVKWIEYPTNIHWDFICRTYNEFITVITKNGVPYIVSFDHDLADEHYQEYTVAHDPKLIGERRIRYEIFKEKTGYDCAKFLAQYCIDNGQSIPLYYIHTLNPIGRQNIFSAMEIARKILTEVK